MRISIREALFGGEELEAWEPPKSEWVHLKDSFRADKWGKEAIELGAPSSYQWSPEKIAKKYYHYKYKGNNTWYYHSQQDTSMQLSPCNGWDFWYNPDKEIAVVLSGIGPGAEESVPQALEDADNR